MWGLGDLSLVQTATHPLRDLRPPLWPPRAQFPDMPTWDSTANVETLSGRPLLKASCVIWNMEVRL